MAKNDHDGPDALLERELAALKAQYESLRDEKVRAEQTLAHLEGELKDLEEQALRDYGTADPAALRARLEVLRAENEGMARAYRAHVDGVRAALDGLERGQGGEG
ncbi:hypothetical protein NNJEOMEG_00939 [Fundidesulfovibrio magnetotacticus]|uniref:Uncharacterized protein n=1 Tax=Fundidesulfovibrio magnetotacticus TaxID=2730080 RepID=A0A6V8LQ55_9BACT|nr:hypothetical protein [Fundidesulfovibrio magnetotacticus]GFK93110.1 hypothetical protein NNJEOMEG_00939 [Fundidesulfovibrio magnetotacticus]